MTETYRPPAVNGGWETVLRRAYIYTRDVRAFGPMGLRCIIRSGGDRGSIIVTQSDHPDYDVEILHASMAFTDRDPSYLELVALHRAVFGRKRWAYQVFAVETEHVNLHEHALHLFGAVDGSPLMTPLVTGGTI